MKVLDLFSGIGGFSLAARWVGWETVGFCEIDPYCQNVLAKNFPGVPIYDDVRGLSGDEIKGVEIITGGFPCQDISSAGRGDGITGQRSGLWSELCRLIGSIRPRYAVVENVPALLYRGMGTVLGDLSEIGYDAEWHVISSYQLGADHERERVWIVAYPAGERQQGSRLGEIAINPKKDAYREASGLVDAFRGGALPYVCTQHDGVPRDLAESMMQAIGNAIDPNVAEVIFRAIEESEHG